MLLPAQELLNMPVMSLQTGTEIAETVGCVIDPDTLNILAYEINGKSLDEHPAFLKIEDIRELSDIGFIVDSSDEVISLDDIVTHKQLYEAPVQLESMHVIDEQHTKLGKVEQLVMDTQSFRVEQLQVRRPFFKSLSDTSLVIHRQQIIAITPDAIIVRTPTVRESNQSPLEKQPLINPFRGTRPPQPESVKSDRH
ncbi:hypothetical protein GII36_04880 [Candidatus Mycosynbacter amalyticus]|uniref:PRC-barrel domain-containing protein n=1 Tax=Candidatus Mycosynbacter amalyticus TaxID=2665156 RepID=A0A857MMT0_9BACT|nr:PRC-barrel domain-containing protein [Candidatus Mycosynbacter amalyticus]QHN43155.1 hypothetical protein GII36_04880 [Candidatus Mycosynbacter amalyticus]